MAVSSLTKGIKTVAKLEFSEEERAELKAGLLTLTKASVIVRSPQRDKDGKCVYVEVPDNGIRLAAIVKALEWDVGKPKAMLELQTGPGAGGAAPGLQDLGRLISRNPEIAAKIIAALRDGLSFAQAIDVTPASEGKPAQVSESQSGGSPSVAG